MISPAMLGEAWSAMSANRMRTFLTMLGMIIGVAAVVLMLAIGQGAQDRVNRAIAQMGSNLLIILSGSTTSGGMRMGSGTAPTLTLADGDAMAELPSVTAVSPVFSGTAQMVHGSNNWSTRVEGVTPSYLSLRDWTLIEGASFTAADVRAATRVVVLGQTVAQNLFGDEAPVGKTIRIQNMPFLVVGLLGKKGQNMNGRDQDDTALVPVTTAQRQLFGTKFPGTVRYIMAQAYSGNDLNQAQDDITQLLRQRHHISDQTGERDDFTIRNLAAMAQTAADTARTFSLLLGAIASISLLVGGIGIMNIMLVSVTERTREIGIRIAIGARRRDITAQFLAESIIISVAGCIIGVAAGVGGAWLAFSLFKMPAVVTLSSIILSLLVAAAVGIFFGLYPARKAARLNPIEALRYQ